MNEVKIRFAVACISHMSSAPATAIGSERFLTLDEAVCYAHKFYDDGFPSYYVVINDRYAFGFSTNPTSGVLTELISHKATDFGYVATHISMTSFIKNPQKFYHLAEAILKGEGDNAKWIM